MNWVTIANLIITAGVPATQKILDNWHNNVPVTPAEFTTVRTLATQTAQDRMKAALEKAGIPLDSAEAVALLNLAQ